MGLPAPETEAGILLDDLFLDDLLGGTSDAPLHDVDPPADHAAGDDLPHLRAARITGLTAGPAGRRAAPRLIAGDPVPHGRAHHHAQGAAGEGAAARVAGRDRRAERGSGDRARDRPQRARVPGALAAAREPSRHEGEYQQMDDSGTHRSLPGGHHTLRLEGVATVTGGHRARPGPKPEDSFLHYALGLEYVKAGDTELALERFEILLHKHPDYLPVYYQAAHLYLENNNRENADIAFKKGIALANRLGNNKTYQELMNAYNNFLYEEDD